MSNPTLADIARAVGVSRTTVSNAYNRSDQLSSELRDRILATAEELGYPGPDPVASGLRRGRTGVVGLVHDDRLSYMFTDPAALLFTTGVASVLDDADISLALLPRLRAGDAGVSVLAAAAVDGFVSICDVVDDARLAALVARRLPFVMVDGGRTPAPCRVGIDDRGASRAAAQHLLDLGHRRLAVVTLPVAPDKGGGPVDQEAQDAIRYTVTAERLVGVREAVEAAGMAWSSVPVLAAPTHESPRWLRHGGADARVGGHHLGGGLLDRADPPTAVVAMSDELAAGVLEAAAERSVDVPGQLSVVGFDDTPVASSTVPPLTTVHQPHVTKGETAARLLLEGAPETVVELPTELVVRASTGPPPSV